MTRGTIATANRARARRRICAAAAAALEVLDLRARYVSENDDRPRAWLERFAREEDRIGACPWRVVKDDRPLFGLLYRLSDAREDVWRHPTHAEGQAWHAVQLLARILRDDCGEPHDAAVVRADAIYRAHLARMEREAVERVCSGPTDAGRTRAAPCGAHDTGPRGPRTPDARGLVSGALRGPRFESAGCHRGGETTMSEREMVSADEAQAMLDGVPDLAEVTAAGQDTLSNAVTGGGRYGAAVQRSGELLGDVERLARTVIALHAIIEGRTVPPTDDELAAHAMDLRSELETLLTRPIPETPEARALYLSQLASRLAHAALDAAETDPAFADARESHHDDITALLARLCAVWGSR